MTRANDEAPHTNMVAPENGRVVIPTQLRQAAQIAPGDELVMYVEDERVVIETRQQLINRTRRDFAANATGASLTDELIADRREEAKREDSE